MKEKNTNFHGKSSGTCTNQKYPWLHATHYFFCYCTLCDPCGEKCREVKCPYCSKDTDFKDYPDKSNSCLKSEKGATLVLKEGMHTIGGFPSKIKIVAIQ